jgi:hypothetical protein
MMPNTELALPGPIPSLCESGKKRHNLGVICRYRARKEERMSGETHIPGFSSTFHLQV